jgi:hypothetical protein
MRKALVGGIVAVLGVSTLALAPAASASTPVSDLKVTVTKTFPAPIRPSLGAGSCGFPITITQVKNQELSIETLVSKKSDGTQVSDTTVVTGPLVLKWTNDTNGKSFTRDVSGKTLTTQAGVNDTVTFLGTGANWEGLGPNGQQNAHRPGLNITHGLIKLTIDPASGTVLTWNLHGTAEDGCALLK